MVINAYGVLSDHLNRILLQKGVESNTLSPLGYELKPGELPVNGLAAVFREATGLIVLPLRLTGLYFRADEFDSLHFCFRCLLRGGTLVIPEGQPEAGFFDSRPLPQPMLPIHQQEVSQTLYHAGGRPQWEQQSISLRTRLRKWFGGKGGEQPAASWQASVTVIVPNDNSQVLWIKRPEATHWELPTAERRPREAPWETAQRALRDTLGNERTIVALPLIYVGKDESKITFVFTAANELRQPTGNLETAFFTPGGETNCLPAHVAQVAEALKPNEETRFILH